MSASASFVIDTAIRGYHVYKDIWPNPINEEQLTCELEVGNSHDPLAVAIKKLIDGSNMIVGHVPKRISPLCSVFIRIGGSITCVVDCPRRYSSDLPQSGLEILAGFNWRMTCNFTKFTNFAKLSHYMVLYIAKYHLVYICIMCSVFFYSEYRYTYVLYATLLYICMLCI